MNKNSLGLLIAVGMLFNLVACDKVSKDSKKSNDGVAIEGLPQEVVGEEEVMLDKSVKKIHQKAEKQADLFSDTAIENTEEYSIKLKSLKDAINDEAREPLNTN